MSPYHAARKQIQKDRKQPWKDQGMDNPDHQKCQPYKLVGSNQRRKNPG